MLAILDYGAGNQTSVWRALRSMGMNAEITADQKTLAGAKGVIFPGVGAAGQAMGRLGSTGLDTVLRTLVQDGKPLLGICLGCQILLEYSEEGPTSTLGIITGLSRRFDPLWQDGDEPIRIPHMGWNSVQFDTAPVTPLLEGIASGSQFYFVHSYYPEPDPELIIATTTYGQEFASIYGREGLWAAQFHPEKSGKPGLKLLANFYQYCLEFNHA